MIDMSPFLSGYFYLKLSSIHERMFLIAYEKSNKMCSHLKVLEEMEDGYGSLSLFIASDGALIF